MGVADGAYLSHPAQDLILPAQIGKVQREFVVSPTVNIGILSKFKSEFQRNKDETITESLTRDF